jgi:hypothetical protein
LSVRGIPGDVSWHSIGSEQATKAGPGTHSGEGGERLAGMEGAPVAQERIAYTGPVYEVCHVDLHDHKSQLATMVAESDGEGVQGFPVDRGRRSPWR